jgi:thiol-disulfide isomerase/thioredoxin
MKTVLLAFIILSSVAVSAQDPGDEFAPVPLTYKSIGKNFDRNAIYKALPGKDLEGKYVLIDMFFQACGPCRASIPYLNDFSDTAKYPRLQVVSVDPFVDDSASMGKFVQQFKIKYPIVTGKAGLEFWANIGNNGYPFLFLVDPSGKILAIESGFSKEGFRNIQRKVKG